MRRSINYYSEHEVLHTLVILNEMTRERQMQVGFKMSRPRLLSNY